MNALALLGAGAALGFSLAASPGPMNAWIATASSRAYRSGVATGLGAMTADVALGAIIFSVNRSGDLAAAIRFVYLAGAAFLLFLTWQSIRRRSSEAPLPQSDLRTFSRALAFGLSNPFQVLWWLTAGLAFAYLGGPILLIGLFGAIGVWVVTFPAAIRAGSRRSPRFEAAVFYVALLTMLAFAGYFAVRAVVG